MSWEKLFRLQLLTTCRVPVDTSCLLLSLLAGPWAFPVEPGCSTCRQRSWTNPSTGQRPTVPVDFCILIYSNKRGVPRPVQVQSFQACFILVNLSRKRLFYSIVSNVLSRGDIKRLKQPPPRKIYQDETLTDFPIALRRWRLKISHRMTMRIAI